MATELQGGGGSATEASDASKLEGLKQAAANAGVAKEFQDGLTAIKNDAEFMMKADQLLQQLVGSIKTT